MIWIPSHTEIKGYELADTYEYAKQAIDTSVSLKLHLYLLQDIKTIKINTFQTNGNSNGL